MNVAVIGTGYVGLVSGVCLASKGHHVLCVDVDRGKVDLINQGKSPIYEEHLEELLEKVVKKNPDDRGDGGCLQATMDLRSAVLASDISIIAVGTPFDGSVIDLKFIQEAARQIGVALREKDDYHVVAVKSTVVPGTTTDVVRPILEETSGKTTGLDFGLGMNPEFLREGEAVEDFMNPDRIVLGGIDERTLGVLEELYDVFEDVDKVRTTPNTAEMIKYASNSLLATMISFSNELGNLCTALGGIDIVEVMRGVHLDKRLSPVLPNGDRVKPGLTTYLEAGCGFGGSCFKKDVKALIAHGRSAGLPMRILESVIEVNDNQPLEVVSLLKKHFPRMKGARVAVLGLAFKPNTADMRESPAIPIVRELMRLEACVKTYDPVAKDEALRLFGNREIIHCDDLIESLEDAEAIVVLTRWGEFAQLPQIVSTWDRPPLIIDGRRMLDKESILRYEGIGLGQITSGNGVNGTPRRPKAPTVAYSGYNGNGSH